MLDTIHFYIANPAILQNGVHYYKYPELTRYIETIANDTVTHFAGRSNLPVTTWSDYVHYSDSGNIVEKAKRFNIKSSHSEFMISHNKMKERFEFNVSLPKYFNGNNVYFLLPSWVNFFDMMDNSLPLFKYLKKCIKVVLRDFVRNNEMLLPLYEDVQIARIDLCFNMYCKDQDEVKRRIVLMNRMQHAGKREDTKNTNYSDETFSVKTAMASSSPWYGKAYNKYVEFKEGDYKRIVKQDPAKAEMIAEFSKRILRYELTLRKDYFDYVFWKHGFARKNERLKAMWDRYQLLRRHFQKTKKVNKKETRTTVELKEHYAQQPKAANDKKVMEYRSLKAKFDGKTEYALNYHIGEHSNNGYWYYNDYDPKTGNFYYDDRIRSKSMDAFLFNKCFKKFLWFVAEYNPKPVDAAKELEKFEAKTIKQVVLKKMLIEGMGLEEIARLKGGVDRTTIWRLKKKFKEKCINIDNKSITEMQDDYYPVNLAPLLHLRGFNESLYHVNNVEVVTKNGVLFERAQLKRQFA